MPHSCNRPQHTNEQSRLGERNSESLSDPKALRPNYGTFERPRHWADMCFWWCYQCGDKSFLEWFVKQNRGLIDECFY